MSIHTLRDVALSTLLSAVLALSASAQGAAPGAPPEQPDQISQLAEAVGLSDEQQAEIRATVDEYTPKIEALQAEAQQAQQELQEKAGPDYEEAEIREVAKRLGDLTGELTALNVIMQSSIESVFTEEQRQALEAQMQEQQRQQQQMQRQLQQQMQRQQQGQ